MIKIIECPRDAMQGIPQQISTENKIKYINQLLTVGFDTIDFGSFVNPKAVPQMADTTEVLTNLDKNSSKSKLLAIIANKKGAETAINYDQINYLGYPFSISETFQLRNTNKTILQSIDLVKDIKSMLSNQELVVYISMGFGNPYGDKWNLDIVEKNVEQIINLGINIISLADTVGVAKPKKIEQVYSRISKSFPNIELGTHLHSTPNNWRDKVQAAYDSGCNRFDAAIGGLGGCPFAKDELVGNIATENLISFFEKKGIELTLNSDQFTKSVGLAHQVFFELKHYFSQYNQIAIQIKGTYI